MNSEDGSTATAVDLIADRQEPTEPGFYWAYAPHQYGWEPIQCYLDATGIMKCLRLGIAGTEFPPHCEVYIPMKKPTQETE